MSENKTPLTEAEEKIKKPEEVSASDERPENKESGKKKPLFSKKKKAPKPESEMTEEEKKEAEKKKRNKPKDAKGSAKRLIGYITKQKVWLIVVAVLVILSTVVTV